MEDIRTTLNLPPAYCDMREWRVLVDALCAVEETDPVDLVEDPT